MLTTTKAPPEHLLLMLLSVCPLPLLVVSDVSCLLCTNMCAYMAYTNYKMVVNIACIVCVVCVAWVVCVVHVAELAPPPSLHLLDGAVLT